MVRFLALGCAGLVAIAANASEPAAPPTTSAGTVRMTTSEISEYNGKFAATDPEFIKCVRIEGPGSMVKRRVCRTNADWSERSTAAQHEARYIVDAIQTHGSTHGEEPVGSVVPAIPN